jgi:hypothetical protein
LNRVGSGSASASTTADATTSGATSGDDGDSSGCGDNDPTPTAAKSSTSATATSSSSVCASAGALGGIEPPPVSADPNAARPFTVDGNTFLTLSAACGRACDIQNKYTTPAKVEQELILVYARTQPIREASVLQSETVTPRRRHARQQMVTELARGTREKAQNLEIKLHFTRISLHTFISRN